MFEAGRTSNMWARGLFALRRATAAAAVAAVTNIVVTTSTPCHAAAGLKSSVQVPVPTPRKKETYEGYDYSRLSFVDGKSPAMRGKMEEFILNLQDEICAVCTSPSCPACLIQSCTRVFYRPLRLRTEVNSRKINGLDQGKEVVVAVGFCR